MTGCAAPRACCSTRRCCAASAAASSETGRLNPEGVELARVNLQRFVALARAIGVARLDVLATAAVRDAADGKDFAAEIERRFGVRVRVLAGAEEGRYSALGVLVGHSRRAGRRRRSRRRQRRAGADRARAAPAPARRCRSGRCGSQHVADDEQRLQATRSTGSSPPCRGSTREPDGELLRRRRRVARARAPPHGAERSIRCTSSRTTRCRAREAENYLELVARQSRKSLERISTISRSASRSCRSRRASCCACCAGSSPSELVFSAGGLREGHLYSLLDAAEQRSDPLIAACAEQAAAATRASAPMGEALFAWTERALPARSRRRASACAARRRSSATSPGPSIPTTAPSRRCATRSTCR